LSELAARALFGAENPGGRRISDGLQTYEVIGVVADVKPALGATPVPTVYTALNRRNFSHPPPLGLTLIVNGASGPATLDGVRRTLAQIDPNLSVLNVHTLRDQLNQVNDYIHIGIVELACIGGFGLVLSCVGLAGVTAYSVARRRRELGIRMALGARRGQVLRLVLSEGSGLVIIGSIFGFAGAFVLARALSGYIELVAKALATSTNEPLLVVGAPVLLAGLAMLACYLPARKIMKTDPLTALREE